MKYYNKLFISLVAIFYVNIYAEQYNNTDNIFSKIGTFIKYKVLNHPHGSKTSVINTTAGSAIHHTYIKSNSEVDVAFSPYENTTGLIIKVIRSAKISICMATYSFTLKVIAKELVLAHNRGVRVMVISDYKESNNKYSVYDYLINSKIDVRMNDKYKIMHNKFIVVDNNSVETGSFNYSNSAVKRNAENVIVFWNNIDIAAIYTNECQRLFNEGI